MKKKWLILLVCLLGVGGIFYYKKITSASSVITDFIPDNTLLLLETTQWLNTNKAPLIQQVPVANVLPKQLAFFKEIGFSSTEIHQFLNKKLLYFAFIPQSKDHISLVNYIPLVTEDELFLDKLLNLGKNTEGIRSITHTTEGQKIHEIFTQSAKPLLAYIIKDNFLIYSQSSLTLEEILLHKKHSWANNLLLKDYSNFTDSTVLVSHINANAIEKFGTQICEKKHTTAPFLSKIINTSLSWHIAEFKAKKITAYSVSGNQELFGEQPSKAFSAGNMIPINCSMLLSFPVEDVTSLNDACAKQIQNDAFLSKLKDKAKDEFDIDFKSVSKKINNEVSLLNIETGDIAKNNKIVLIKNKDLVQDFRAIALQVAQKKEQKPFNMQFGSFGLIALGVKEFPALVLGPIFYGFNDCIFTEYKDYIVLGSNLATLQDYLLSISKNEVWASSSRQQQLLKNCQPANLTLVIDHAKAIPMLGGILNTHWLAQAKTFQENLGAFDYILFQSNEEKGILTLLQNHLGAALGLSKYSNVLVKLNSIAQGIVFKPFFLTNPQTKKQEILVQNTDNQLYLLVNGKKVWHYALAGKMVDEPKFMKVRGDKLQRLFIVTTQKAYILTRTDDGFDVLTSPNVKGLNAKGLAIFETNGSNELTMLNANGYQFTFDKLTLNLIFSQKIAPINNVFCPLPTLMVKGNLFVVCLDENGKLSLINTNGSIASGFPIQTNIQPLSSPVLDINDGNANILLMGQKGELLKIGFSGKILQKNQFFRPDNEYKFAICASEKPNDWVVVRSNNKTVTVLDKNDKEIFTLKNLTFGRKYLKYYNLGAGKKFFALFNGWTSYTLYDEKGELVADKPILSQSAPSITYAESYNKLIITTHTGTSIDTWSVKLK